MVVHFPIAFWLGATGAWVMGLVRRSEFAWRFGLWQHVLGLVGAAASVGFGFWATYEMGHGAPGHGLVHVHRDWMLVASGIAVVVTCGGWYARNGSRRSRVLLTLASAALVGVMTIGADRGAELVYRFGVGVALDTPPDDGHAHAHAGDHADAEDEASDRDSDGHGLHDGHSRSVAPRTLDNSPSTKPPPTANTTPRQDDTGGAKGEAGHSAVEKPSHGGDDNSHTHKKKTHHHH